MFILCPSYFITTVTMNCISWEWTICLQGLNLKKKCDNSSFKNSKYTISSKTYAQNLQVTNVHFSTISSHFFKNYINIFHKTEVHKIILKCSTGLNYNGLYIYDRKSKYFRFLQFCKKKLICVLVLPIFAIFAFFICVITFEPNKSQIPSAPQTAWTSVLWKIFM